MEAATAVLNQPPPLRFSSSSCYSNELKTSTAASVFMARRGKALSGISSSLFCDRSHVQYYGSNSGSSSCVDVATTMSAKQEKKEKSVKKMKKQLKLLKGLSRDLSTFSQMGFGLDCDGALIDQVKGGMITEATELLLEQLQKLKANKKQLKRKMKEEKARSKAAVQNRSGFIDCEMSFSSSESSDSECGELFDMNALKNRQIQKGPQQVIQEPHLAHSPTPIIIPSLQPNFSDEQTPEREKIASKLLSSCALEKEVDNLSENNNPGIMVVPSCSKKIEVCMGGKCKKSGASALLEEFQRAVGIEGAVSGCKCMGKCRDGPNVKVLSGGFDGGVVVDSNSISRVPDKSLCIGVGLEDVDMIVANLLGENNSQLGFAVAS